MHVAFRLCISFAITLVLLFALDRMFVPLHRWRLPDLDQSNLPTVPDPVLGYREKAEMRFDAYCIIGGREEWRATYTTDKLGWRVTPANEIGGPRHEFAVFFGCSFTFGWAVEDDETLPNLFAEEMQEYRVYNFAANGYGSQQMLALLESGEVDEVVQEKRGIVVYVFFSGQLGRTVGDLRSVSRFAAQFPTYAPDGNGGAQYLGPYAEAYPRRYALYSLLGKSGFVDFFKLNYPLAASDRHCDVVTSIVLESRRIAREQLNADEFYVLVYPATKDARKVICAKVVPAFRNAGLRVFDYSELLDLDNLDYVYAPEFDGHPKPVTHRIVAERFLADLEELEAGLEP